ncbi:MAG: cyclic nucleotide-binding domain-containing protein [Calditrichaeota bacterium]|nr:MAG: cyclic nucleotide-binding domain-containing protein [Calditrichota bacterium]
MISNSCAELETKSIFVGLSARQLQKLSQCMALRTFAPGEIILQEGSCEKSLNIIRTGKVRIFKSAEGGNRILLAELCGKKNLLTQYGGEFFGEMSLFDFEPVSATVIAAEPCEIWQITQADLLDLFSQDKDLQLTLLMNLVRVLSRRLRLANQHSQARLTARNLKGPSAKILEKTRH